MPKHVHASMSVRGMLRDNLRLEHFRGLLKHEDGTPVSATDAVEVFLDCLANGR